MKKRQFKKLFIFFSLIAFTLCGMLRDTLAQKGELGDESWTVEKRLERTFYFTHGTVVWGHEFGFFKASDCENDILWLTFSSREEKVKNFSGNDVTVSLIVDGKDYRIRLPMFYAGIIGYTHIMYFSNWVVGEQLMDALKKGRYVKVQILEPKELEALLDIKEDEFGLNGFTASRKEAGKTCKNNITKINSKSVKSKEVREDAPELTINEEDLTYDRYKDSLKFLTEVLDKYNKRKGKDLGWEVESLGVPNYLSIVKGYGLKAQRDIARLELKNAKLNGVTKEKIAILEGKLKETEKRLQYFFEHNAWVD